MMLPLDHRFPNLLIRSIPRSSGKIRPDIIRAKNELVQILNDKNFPCVFVATDGDNGTDKDHEELFKVYEESIGCLRSIAEEFLSTRESFPPLAASDLLHLMKNARSRIALGKLAFFGKESTIITGATVTGPLAARQPRLFHAKFPLSKTA